MYLQQPGPARLRAERGITPARHSDWSELVWTCFGPDNSADYTTMSSLKHVQTCHHTTLLTPLHNTDMIGIQILKCMVEEVDISKKSYSVCLSLMLNQGYMFICYKRFSEKAHNLTSLWSEFLLNTSSTMDWSTPLLCVVSPWPAEWGIVSSSQGLSDGDPAKWELFMNWDWLKSPGSMSPRHQAGAESKLSEKKINRYFK